MTEVEEQLLMTCLPEVRPWLAPHGPSWYQDIRVAPNQTIMSCGSYYPAILTRVPGRLMPLLPPEYFSYLSLGVSAAMVTRLFHPQHHTGLADTLETVLSSFAENSIWHVPNFDCPLFISRRWAEAYMIQVVAGEAAIWPILTGFSVLVAPNCLSLLSLHGHWPPRCLFSIFFWTWSTKKGVLFKSVLFSHFQCH